MSLAARIQLTSQDSRSISATSGGERLGQQAVTTDGRVYVFALAGASNLSAGKLTQAPAITTGHFNRTGIAGAIGATSVSFVVATNAVTANQYAQGYFAVSVGPGQNLYLVEGNTAATSTGTPTVTLREPLTVAITTGSKVGLYPHPLASTVLYDHNTIAQPATGVPNVAVTAANYYWSQVGGYCAVLNDGVIAKNVGAIPSDAVDGSVETEVAGTTQQRVGFAPEATVDTEYRPVVLTMA